MFQKDHFPIIDSINLLTPVTELHVYWFTCRVDVEGDDGHMFSPLGARCDGEDHVTS